MKINILLIALILLAITVIARKHKRNKYKSRRDDPKIAEDKDALEEEGDLKPADKIPSASNEKVEQKKPTSLKEIQGGITFDPLGNPPKCFTDKKIVGLDDYQVNKRLARCAFRFVSNTLELKEEGKKCSSQLGLIENGHAKVIEGLINYADKKDSIPLINNVLQTLLGCNDIKVKNKTHPENKSLEQPFPNAFKDNMTRFNHQLTLVLNLFARPRVRKLHKNKRRN